MYFVLSRAALVTSVDASSAREAFLKHRAILQAWCHTQIGSAKGRIVDNFMITPLDKCEIRVVNEDADTDTFLMDSDTNHLVGLQTVLGDFIKDADSPASDTPAELVAMAKQLAEALQKH